MLLDRFMDLSCMLWLSLHMWLTCQVMFIITYYCISAMSSSFDGNESDKDEPEGHNLAHRILQPEVLYDPHDTT